jgi:hypothetical protein
VAPNWYEMAEKQIDEEDQILKNFPGKLDGERGHLFITNKKILFVHEEGFLRKSYDITLDLPYNKISKISTVERYELDITDKEGKKHEFISSDFPVAPVERFIEEAAHTVYA